MKFLIVTGMSGSGKSKAMDALEDFGFYCIDNVPPALLHEFVKLFSERGGISEKVAIGVDVRSNADSGLAEIIKVKADFIDLNKLNISVNSAVKSEIRRAGVNISV